MRGDNDNFLKKLAAELNNLPFGYCCDNKNAIMVLFHLLGKIFGYCVIQRIQSADQQLLSGPAKIFLCRSSRPAKKNPYFMDCRTISLSSLILSIARSKQVFKKLVLRIFHN